TFITGNLCPKLYVLNAIPSTIVQDTANPNAATEIQYRAKDPDGTCGNNCDPQTCTTANPPVCTPAPYNPNDPLCNPAAGGSPTAPACLASGAGLVCTVAAWPSASNPGGPGTAPGGTFLSPLDQTTPVGPVLPVNLNTASGIPGLILPGLGGPAGTNQAGPLAGTNPIYPFSPTQLSGQLPPLQYLCDLLQPGPTYITVSCSDGDAECDQAKAIVLTCPGINYCVDQPTTCVAPAECQTTGTCDPSCDPADIGGPGCPGGTRCPGAGAPVADGTTCSTGQCLGGVCVECTSNAGCANKPSTPVDCQLPNTCTGNVCVAGGIAPSGTSCSNGICDGSGIGAGACVFQACDPCEASCGQTGGADFNPTTCEQTLTMGCTNNVTSNVSILPFKLTANPQPVLANSSFNTALTGVAVFSESFLDAGLATVPGLKQATLVSAAATVHVRSGATGPDKVLNAAPIPLTCSGGMNAGLACTTAADCPPGAPYVSCAQIVIIPTIDGTGDACAACNAINSTKAAQCAANGYCIAPGDLPLQLESTSASWTAGASGSVLFGWDDVTTGATVAGNGTWNLPAASFGGPVTPNGVRVIAAVLQVALQCTMG
ncbi:MAG: hypothetical protein WCF10_07195, partial [Polyangiales bacterium]